MKHIMLLLSSCLGLCVAAQFPEPTLPVPPQERGILGAWIGFDAEAVSFYRLVIMEKGGLFAYSSPGDPVWPYAVVSWSLKQSRVYLEMTNSTPTAGRIHISGRATSYRLDLTIEGTDGTGGTWTREIAFFREQNIEARMRELQQAMKTHSTLGSVQHRR
jgi:hypothetical protein